MSADVLVRHRRGILGAASLGAQPGRSTTHHWPAHLLAPRQSLALVAPRSARAARTDTRHGSIGWNGLAMVGPGLVNGPWLARHAARSGLPPPQDAAVQAVRSTRRNCPPPASTCVVSASCGARRDSRSNSHMAALSASAWLGQRATTSRPPLRVNRSTVATIGAGSTTNSSGDQATTGLTAPLRVLQARCARRSTPAAAFLPFGEAPLSTLGPRSALTDASGSTGSSHSQQRQASRSPTSLRELMARGYGSARC